nr:Sensor protein [uncultured bacterium]
MEIPVELLHWWRRIRMIWAVPLLLTVFLLTVSRSNFLLFHTLAEFFCSLVGIMMCVVAWNTHAFSRNHFLMFLGVGYFWVGCIDIVHTLVYRGMGIIDLACANPATQLWLVARYFGALILLSAPLFLARWAWRMPTFVLLGALATFFTALVMNGHFPDAFVEGSGLTRFKVTSEFVIVGLLLAAMAHLYYRRALVPSNVMRLIAASIVLTIVSEMAFVTYVDVYDFSLIVGHVFKFLAYWLLFVAIVRTTLTEPYQMMARGSSTYDAIPLATVVVDREGFVSHVNRAACHEARCNETDILGRLCHNLFHPREASADDCPVCAGIRKGEAISGLEVSFADTDIWREFTLSPINAPIGLTGMVQVSIDITERKKAEIALRHNMALLAEAERIAKLGNWEWNIASDRLTLSEEACRIFGWDKDENDVTWESVMAAVHPEDRSIVDFHIKAYLRGEMECDFEYRIVRHGGAERLVREKAVVSLDTNGTPVRMVGTIHDITEITAFQKHMVGSQRLEIMSSMAAGVVHEINNLIGIISGYVGLARMVLGEENGKDYAAVPGYLDNANAAIEQASEITQELMMFSRQTAISVVSVSVGNLIEHVSKLIFPILGNGIVLEIDVERKDAAISVDRRYFSQAIINLVANACHAMPGGGKLRIACYQVINAGAAFQRHPSLRRGHLMAIQISDTGTGMDEKTMARIFEPFFTTKGEGDGTGLGLSVAYGLIEQMGGAIEVESRLGSGATFTIILPCEVPA